MKVKSLDKKDFRADMGRLCLYEGFKNRKRQGKLRPMQ